MGGRGKLRAKGCDSSNGWLEYERHCYKLISPSGDYGAIEQLCLATGPSPGGVKISSLADVQSQAENDFIAEVVAGGNRAWIAGARYGTDNWIWSLNNRVGVSMGVSYTNWKPNAPDNHLDQEGCIEINRGPAGKWNDLKCTKKRPGVCKYSIDQWKTSIDQLNPGQTKKI